jgi:hypothetical protein
MVIVGSLVSKAVREFVIVMHRCKGAMKHPRSLRRMSRVPWLALVLVFLQWGCVEGEDGHPATYQYDATPSHDPQSDPCAVPNQGCACPNPGEVVDCGKVIVRVDGYETCYEGSRICQGDSTWGACASDQAIVQLLQ